MSTKPGQVHLAGLGTLTFLGVLGAQFAKEAVPEQRKMWARVAAKYGGEHKVGPSDRSARYDRIIIPLPAGTIVIEEGEHPGVKGYRLIVRATLDVPLPEFRIVHQEALQTIGKALGGQDIVLGGDSSFDEAFVVRGPEPALLRRLWTPHAKQLLSEKLGDLVRLTVSERNALSIVMMTDVEEAQLVGAIDLAMELAARDLYGTEALRAVEGRVGLSPDFVPVLEVRRPHAVRVKPLVINDKLRTTAALLEKPPASTTPIILHIPGTGTPAKLEPSALPAPALRFLSGCGPALLEVTPEREVFLRFNDIVEDPERIRAAVGLLNALCASPTQAVYR